MNLIKSIIVALGLTLIGIGSASAQIPVTDVASLTQQMQQVVSWGQQLQQMKAQIDQQKQMYASVSGSRGLGQLLNDPTLRSALPADWQQVYAAIQKGGYSGLTDKAKAIRDSNAIYSCQGSAAADQQLCNRELNKVAQDKANAMVAYDAAGKRLDNIQALMAQIDNTTDAKAIGELQTRMQAEQAMIQNEQTKLIMFKMMADSEDKLIAQQKREQDLQDVTRRGRTADSLKIRTW